MTIIDFQKSVIPMKYNSKKGGEIHKRLIYRGFSLDGRTLTNNDIRSMYENTANMLLKRGILSKVKIGHYQELEDQKLQGFVKELELQENSQDEGGGLSIWAKMFLFEDVYNDYIDGRYPEVSIGAPTKMKTKEGDDMGQVIEHVALLGSERAANPDPRSSNLSINNIINNLAASLKSQLNNLFRAEGGEMPTPNELMSAYKALKSSVMSAFSEMDKAFSGGGGGQAGGAPTEEKKNDEEKRSVDQQVQPTQPQQMQSTIDETKKSLEIDESINKSIQKLVGEGRLNKSQIDKYKTLAKKSGVEFAEEFYNEATQPIPKIDEDRHRSYRPDPRLSEVETKELEIMRAMNKSDDEIDERKKEILKSKGVE